MKLILVHYNFALTGVKKDATEKSWMCGMPLIRTSTAKMEPSQLTAICVTGEGMGIFRTGAFELNAVGDSKSFMQITKISDVSEPTKTSP
jgi:hypothetical protein